MTPRKPTKAAREAARERWLAIRHTIKRGPTRRRGVLLPWRPAPPAAPRSTTMRQRRDSTRAARARRDREAMTP